MSPQGDERQAREEIDRLLTAAGWLVCDPDKANLSAHRSVATREFPLPCHGYVNYLLSAAGVIEAKKQGAMLTGVEAKFNNCRHGLTENLAAWERSFLCRYKSTSARCVSVQSDS